MVQKKRKKKILRRHNAAMHGSYRKVLEFVEEYHLRRDGCKIGDVSKYLDLKYDTCRRLLDRGVFDGYLSLTLGFRQTRYYRWSFLYDLPLIGPKEARAEAKRISQIEGNGEGAKGILVDGAMQSLRKVALEGVNQRQRSSRTNKSSLITKTSALEAQEGTDREIILVKRRRAGFRCRETRKTQIGTTYLVPWIIARGVRPDAPWANDFGLFITEVLQQGNQINLDEDRRFLDFLTEPWIYGNAVSGLSLRCLVISEASRLTKDCLNMLEAFLQMDSFQEQVGQLRVSPWGRDGDAIVVGERTDSSILGMREPTVRVAGLDTRLTGGHYDLHIWDDVVSDKCVGNAAMIRKSKEKYQIYQPFLARGGRSYLVMYGTFYDPADLYHDIVKGKQDFEIFLDPVLDRQDYYLDENGEIQIREGAQSRFPATWPMHEVVDRLISMGSYHFAGQMLLDFSKIKPAEFRREDFVFFTQDTMPRRVTTYLLADLAETQDIRACYTCIWVVQVDTASRKWVRDLRIGRWDVDTVFRMIQELMPWKPRALVTESGPQSIIYEAAWNLFAMANAIRLPWIKVRRTADMISKIRRLQTLVGPIKRGDLCFDHRLKSVKAFSEIAWPQFLNFGRDTKDAVDALDALSVHCGVDESGRDVVYCPLAPPSEDPIRETTFIDEILNPAPEESIADSSIRGSRFRVGYRRR